MNAEELRKILNEKGMDWLIAAMVDGSIGYHTPQGSKQLIEGAMQGETKSWCERCMACFSGNLLEMIECDVKRMEYLEEHYPEKAKKLIDRAKKISVLSQAQQSTISLMYPTMGV